MNKKFKRIFSVILAMVMVVCLNVSVFAQPEKTDDTPLTYHITIDGKTYDVEEGSYVQVPLKAINTSSASTRDVVPGDAGTLNVWGSGHYFHWLISMHIPATSFIGDVSSFNMNTGIINHNNPVSGFGGSIYCASTVGHRYSATLSGNAYNGAEAVAYCLANRVTCVCS